MIKQRILASSPMVGCQGKKKKKKKPFAFRKLDQMLRKFVNN